MNSRLGYLGHYYPGMLDMYSDLTMHQGKFGTHIEILEMCDLAHRVHQVTETEVDKKVEATRQMFLMPPPGYDAITEQVNEDELRWAAPRGGALRIGWSLILPWMAWRTTTAAGMTTNTSGSLPR